MKENLIKKIGKTGLYIVQGDITQIQTDAIMTAINSHGLWNGGINGAIQKVAGDRYHYQLERKMPLSDLQTIVAFGSASSHQGKFDDVIFVIDNLRSSLDKVIYAGLEAAHQEGYGQLLIPAIRMGLMAGEVERTPRVTIAKLGKGIDRFMQQYGDQTTLEKLTFVVYKDPSLFTKIQEYLVN